MKGRGAVMSIKFHCLSGSPFSWKVWLALEHKALTYDIQVLKADAGDVKRPEYPAIGQGDKAIEKCNVPGWRPNRPSNSRSRANAVRFGRSIECQFPRPLTPAFRKFDGSLGVLRPSTNKPLEFRLESR